MRALFPFFLTSIIVFSAAIQPSSPFYTLRDDRLHGSNLGFPTRFKPNTPGTRFKPGRIRNRILSIRKTGSTRYPVLNTPTYNIGVFYFTFSSNLGTIEIEVSIRVLGRVMSIILRVVLIMIF